MTASLSLTVNGEPRKSSAATIAALVRELELKPEKVAVERNGVIVPRSTLAETPLADGDVLEIVTFVGGGDHNLPLPLRERREARQRRKERGRRRQPTFGPPLCGGPLTQPSPARGEG